MIITVPTTPYIASDGAISSLIGLADRSKIKVSGNGPKHISGNATPEINSSTVSIDVAASMGFGSMVDINVSSDAIFFMVELHTKEQPIQGAPGGIVLKEHYGVSIRICIKAWSFKGEVASNLGTAAAKASADSASVCYQVDVLGLKLADLRSLPGLVSSSVGAFDITKMQMIGAVFSELTEFVAKSPQKCHPELIAVDVNLKDIVLPFHRTSSNIFGLGRIATGVDFTDAVKKLPPHEAGVPTVETAVVESLYEGLVKTLTGPPNKGQRDYASQVLRLGADS